MKCDGVRPVCGPCSRANRPDDCEYTDGQGRTRTQILEENIAHLEARIQELENPDSAQAPIMLHNPHSPSYQSRHGSPAPRVMTPHGRLHAGSRSSGTSSPNVGEFQGIFNFGAPWQPLDLGLPLDPRGHATSSTTEGWWDAEEPPMTIAQQLMDHFFQHASQLGWFMHVTRFRHSVMLTQGNVNRPIPALLNAVYLWGASFSRHSPEGDLSMHEVTFLSRALSQIGHALSGAPTHQTVQAIQARLLLATYHYCTGKFIEGRHQSDSAAALAMACGLHKIRSAQLAPPSSTYVDVVPITLMDSRDQIEEGERINALWTAFSMDRCWAVAFGAPTIISDSDAFGTQIDTPWPLDMETYERGQIYPNLRTSCTLRNFLGGINTGWPWENQSMLAQVSKASALFERATHLAECWRPEIPNMNAFYNNFISIDQRIEEFKGQLYLLENIDHSDSDVLRTTHTSHCLAHAATIQLHSVFAQQNAASRNKCLAAGTAIVRANAIVRAYEFPVINPILGTVWAAACQVFIRELVSLRSFPLEPTPIPADQETELRSSLDQLQAVMAVFAPVCALINYQHGKVQQERVGL
ncbi:hypothetical protein DENSPDRAFT_841812 [Dentipellis sp. KUC8613]|nr:hypothetical protein DENSPDRAFT_841812 [Dentipellis sp. KUC8613]